MAPLACFIAAEAGETQLLPRGRDRDASTQAMGLAVLKNWWTAVMHGCSLEDMRAQPAAAEAPPYDVIAEVAARLKHGVGRRGAPCHFARQFDAMLKGSKLDESRV